MHQGLCRCSGWSGRRLQRQSAQQHRLDSMATSPPAAMASLMRPKPAAAAAAAAAAQRKRHQGCRPAHQAFASVSLKPALQHSGSHGPLRAESASRRAPGLSVSPLGPPPQRAALLARWSCSGLAASGGSAVAGHGAIVCPAPGRRQRRQALVTDGWLARHGCRVGSQPLRSDAGRDIWRQVGAGW